MDMPIKSYALPELNDLMADLGQPAFRAKQIAQWLYVHRVHSYDEMTNLPASLRSMLSERFPLFVPTVVERAVSHDGTKKYLIEYHDGVRVETVSIPSRNGDRLTVCFSTQAGCPMACTFCATGKEGFVRNLAPGEIVDQVLIAQEDAEHRVSNVVGMGQGEPFLNYDNSLAALRILNGPKGLAIGARHMSVSTCGLIAGIDRFAREPEQFTLAISLHAALQSVRDALMPNVARDDLPSLKSALQSYVAKTNRRVTLEHIMIRDMNDTQEDLDALCSFCSDLLCHVNLIPMNAVDDSPLQPSSSSTVQHWLSTIQNRGTEATLRESRGSDIAGACGQLKNSFNSRNEQN